MVRRPAQSYRSVARATRRLSSTSGDVAGSQDQGNLSVRHEDLTVVERFVLPPLRAGGSSYFKITQIGSSPDLDQRAGGGTLCWAHLLIIGIGGTIELAGDGARRSAP